MTVLSLFDGLSCGQLALKKAGIVVDKYYASEIEKAPIAMTMHNFPNTIQLGDVTKVRYENGILYSENGEFNVGKIDIVFGGSPCQSLSNAGKGAGFSGKSGLFFEFLRILEEVKPQYFLLENVKMKKEWRDEITNNMKVEPILIDSALLTAQHRERYYWTNIPNLSQPVDKQIFIKDILEPSVDEKFYLSEKKVNLILSGVKYGQSQVVCDVNKKTFTLMAGMGTGGGNEPRFYDPVTNRLRRVTPLECDRLQGVDDNYTLVPYNGKPMSNCHRYKALGNGWTVDVIAHIFKGMI